MDTAPNLRPACPSRRPLRENVTFFDSPEGARRGGFRACRRCHPDRVGSDQLAVARVLNLLETEESAPSLAELASEVGFSPTYLQRVFKRHTGLSPKQYGDSLRQQRFRRELRQSGRVTDAVYDAGFGSTRGAYERATENLGMSPSAFQQGGRGERITYALTRTDLGDLLVAATARGVCAVRFGTEEDLVSELSAEFPRAELIPDSEAMSDYVQVARWAVEDGSGESSSIRLDAQGSEFQQTVWSALREIPAGQTRTYSQIAEAIGQPRAARAVAMACATNPLALLTPCHRVVRADGAPGGYRWGIERKQALLRREGAIG